jgi:hypothetical protein
MNTPTKTAMMELIEDCQHNLSGIAISVQEMGLSDVEKQHYRATALCLKTIIKKCSELMEKEKTQIVDAHEAGFLSNDLPIEYYNKTYKQ